MSLDATRRRRRLGSLMLLMALAMLIAGQTILKTRLKDFGFLFYWLLCFVFTAVAILMLLLLVVPILLLQRLERRAMESPP